MEPIRHPIAPENIPYFITAPGSLDQMLLVVAVVLLIAVLMLGGFYFWLHSLPERVAAKRRRAQMELVAVLGLVGLFTHNNAFWIAALLLAMVELPIISGPLARIADSLEALAGLNAELDGAPKGGEPGEDVTAPSGRAKQATQTSLESESESSGGEASPAIPKTQAVEA